MITRFTRETGLLHYRIDKQVRDKPVNLAGIEIAGEVDSAGVLHEGSAVQLQRSKAAATAAERKRIGAGFDEHPGAGDSAVERGAAASGDGQSFTAQCDARETGRSVVVDS